MLRTPRPAPVYDWLRKLWTNRKGNACIEFTLVAPVLILITAGITDVGTAMWVSSTLETAATDTARFAMIHGADSDAPASEADIQTFATKQAIGVPSDALTVNVSWSPNNSPGSTVQIELSHQYDFMFFDLLQIPPILLTGIASRIVE